MIYQGSISSIKEYESFSVPGSINSVTVNLPETGKYQIEFYNVAGRKAGTYYFTGKKAQNLITPPFIVSNLGFYEIKKGNRIIDRGRIVYVR